MIFGDLGEAMVNILYLRLPDGPGWCVGADRCLKRDLKSYLDQNLCRKQFYETRTSRIGINTWSTSPVDFSTHSRYMDIPSWCPDNWETLQRFYRWNGFVTTPGSFYVNFPENHDFGWSRREHGDYSRFEAFGRSRVMSRCGQMSEAWSEVIWIKFYVENSLTRLLLVEWV